jgi:DNA mismatch repair protein MutL
LIDQHALHEKVLFEEVSRRLDEGRVDSQRLLFPEVVEIGPELMPLVERATELLAPLGFEIEPFGPGSLAIHAFPALLDREAGTNDISGIVRSVLESLLGVESAAGGGRSPTGEPPRARESDSSAVEAGEAVEAGGRTVPVAVRDAVRRVAATIACKRAVKAGAPLGPDEIRALLKRGSIAKDPRNCPHGRPTSVFLSRRDLERQFDRK